MSEKEKHREYVLFDRSGNVAFKVAVIMSAPDPQAIVKHGSVYVLDTGRYVLAESVLHEPPSVT